MNSERLSQTNSISPDTNLILEDNSTFIKTKDCGEINLLDFKFLNINDIFFGPSKFPLLNCLSNAATDGDSTAQIALLEISKMVSENVQKFDVENSSNIISFLEQTLFLTEKGNAWLPILFKFAYDKNCHSNSDCQFPTVEHYGSLVSDIFIDNLKDKNYAKELADFQNKLFKTEYSFEM